MTGDNPEITVVEAKAILQKETQEIVERCRIEMQEILDKYECRMEISMVVKGSGNTPQVVIMRMSK